METITDGPNSAIVLKPEFKLPNKITSMEDVIEMMNTAHAHLSVVELAADNPNLMEYLEQLEKQVDQLHAMRNLKYSGAEVVRVGDTDKPECIRVYVEIPYVKGVVKVCGTLGEAYDLTKGK